MLEQGRSQITGLNNRYFVYLFKFSDSASRKIAFGAQYFIVDTKNDIREGFKEQVFGN